MDEPTRFALSISEAEAHSRRARELVSEAGRRLDMAQQMAAARGPVNDRAALRASAERDWALAPEIRDARDEMARSWGIQPLHGNSFFLRTPLQSTRTLTATDTGAAAELVGIANQLRVVPAHDTVGAIFGLMTVNTALAAAGNQFVGNFATLPTVTVLADEATAATEQTPATGQALLTPKNLVSYGRHSRQWALQSDAGGAALIRVHVNAVSSKALQQILEGTGTSNQLLGLTANSDVPTAAGTTVDMAKVCTAMASVEATGSGPFAWVVSAAAAKLLRQRAEVSGGPAILRDGRIGGYPCYVTGCTANAIAVFGSWSDLQVFQWRPIEVAADPYTDFAGQLIGVRVWLAIDALPMLPKSFYTLTGVT